MHVPIHLSSEWHSSKFLSGSGWHFWSEKSSLFPFIFFVICYSPEITFIRLAFKVVLTSTAIYWTNQLEVWSKLSQNERQYDRLIACAKHMIRQNTPNQLKFEVSWKRLGIIRSVQTLPLQIIICLFYSCPPLWIAIYARPQTIIITKVLWIRSNFYWIFQRMLVVCMIRRSSNWMHRHRNRVYISPGLWNGNETTIMLSN